MFHGCLLVGGLFVLYGSEAEPSSMVLREISLNHSFQVVMAYK